jgi:hypothetical protein
MGGVKLNDKRELVIPTVHATSTFISYDFPKFAVVMQWGRYRAVLQRYVEWSRRVEWFGAN